MMACGRRACSRAIIAGDPPVGRRGLRGNARLAGVWERCTELLARADVELGEDLTQVVLDRSGADEELGADLGVGAAVDREPGDLLLLRRQLVERLRRALADALARREQLATGALGERLCPHATERVVRRTQLRPRVHTAALATKPLAVQQLGAGVVHDDA